MRQYIGARYVPAIFNNNGSSEWIRGVSYEALTIVTYINNSYISRKNVPSSIGNPAENSEYWTVIANYNIQFNNLKETVETFDERITNNQTDIMGLQNFVNKGFTSLGNLNVLIITDSYGQGAPNIITWVEQLGNEITRQGGKYYHIANGGGGFIANGQQGTFTDCVKNAPNNKFNLILIQGMINDTNKSTPSAINQAMYNFYNNAKTKFPGVPMMLFNVSKNTTVGASCRKNRRQISTYAKHIGFIYADMSPYYIINKLNIGEDGVHPNQEGHNDIYNGVMEFLQKRNNFLERKFEINPILTLNGSQAILFITNNGIVKNETGIIIPVNRIPWLWGNNIDYYAVGRALYQNANHPITYKITDAGIGVDFFGTAPPIETLIVQNSYIPVPLEMIA